ncbi:hypothetical protein Droror1_Dr00008732 [Drosera rotundifolia]
MVTLIYCCLKTSGGCTCDADEYEHNGWKKKDMEFYRVQSKHNANYLVVYQYCHGPLQHPFNRAVQLTLCLVIKDRLANGKQQLVISSNAHMHKKFQYRLNMWNFRSKLVRQCVQ